MFLNQILYSFLAMPASEITYDYMNTFCIHCCQYINRAVKKKKQKTKKNIEYNKRKKSQVCSNIKKRKTDLKQDAFLSFGVGGVL
jgi:hypothetical protein